MGEFLTKTPEMSTVSSMSQPAGPSQSEASGPYRVSPSYKLHIELIYENFPSILCPNQTHSQENKKLGIRDMSKCASKGFCFTVQPLSPPSEPA